MDHYPSTLSLFTLFLKMATLQLQLVKIDAIGRLGFFFAFFLLFPLETDRVSIGFRCVVSGFPLKEDNVFFAIRFG